MAEKNPADIETTAAPETETPQPEAPPKKAGKAKGGEAGKIAALEEKLAQAEAKTTEAKESLLRTAAEYDNYRKRSQKEHEAAFGNGVSHAVTALLPVLDTLEAAANAETKDEDYKKGVVMTLAKCDEIFKGLGIEKIPAMGQPFDPELHNAVMQEAAEGAESGTVTRVMQTGYTLHGKVVRHAMVAVAP